MRRKTAIVGFSYLAGMFFASFLPKNAVFAACGKLLILCAFSLLLKKPYKICAVTVILSAFVGVFVYGVYLETDYLKATSYDGKTAEFSGKIIEERYVSNDVMLVTAKGKIEGKTRATVSFFIPDSECTYYDNISLKVEFSEIKDTVAFSGKSYNNAKGIYLQGKSPENVKITKGGFSVVKYVRLYSDYLYDKISRILPGDEGAFIGAMLCGDKTGIDRETKTNLYRLGIGHIFSVSGTHLVIVAFVVNAFLGLLKISKRKKLFVSEIVITGFVIFAGMSSSVVRAAIMMTVINISKSVKRYPDSITTLAVCGVLLTIFTPYQIRSASFLLSMAGAFSLGTAAPLVVKALALKNRFSKLINSFVSMCVIWVCTLPFCLMFFNEVSVVSPIANMLFVPLCTFALVISVIVGFTGGVNVIAVPLLKIAAAAVKPVIIAAEKIGNSSWSYIPLGYGFLKISVAVILVITIAVGLYKRKTMAVVRTVVIGMIGLIMLSTAYMLSRDDTVEIYAINYKDSSVLVLNKNRKAVIIDKDGKSADACVRLLAAKGITEVRSVFVLENCESVRAVYNDKLDFCKFDSNNCFDISETSSVEFENAEIAFENGGLYVKYGEIKSALKLDTDFSPAECNLIFDVSGEEKLAETAYETVIFSDDTTVGGIAAAEIKKDKNPKVRRFDYAFG